MSEESRQKGTAGAARQVPAEEHHHGIGLGRDEAQQEDIPAATVVALQHRLAQWAVLVQRHLFAFGSDQMVHDVAAGREMSISTQQDKRETKVCRER